MAIYGMAHSSVESVCAFRGSSFCFLYVLRSFYKSHFRSSYFIHWHGGIYEEAKYL